MFKSNTCLQTVKCCTLMWPYVLTQWLTETSSVACVFVLWNKWTSYSMILHIRCNILTCECKIVNCEFVGSLCYRSEPLQLGLFYAVCCSLKVHFCTLLIAVCRVIFVFFRIELLDICSYNLVLVRKIYFCILYHKQQSGVNDAE